MHATRGQLKSSVPEADTVRPPRVAVFSATRQWDEVLETNVTDGVTIQFGGCDIAYFRGAVVDNGEDARKALRNAANDVRARAIEFAIVLCSGQSRRSPGGGLFIVEDHVNWTGDNPLIGMRQSEPGERFIDLADAYDPQLRNILSNAAREADFSVASGVGVEGFVGKEAGFGCFESDAQLSGLALPVISARQAGARVAAVAWLDPAETPSDGTPSGEKGYPILGVRRFLQNSILSVVALSGV